MYTLLIIDDEKEVRDAISRLIDWEGLRIRLIGNAGNGLEGLNMILDEYPDIVMTDIRMPGLSGIDLIRKVSEINGDTNFIILTGFGEFEYAKQAMQYGVRHYLLKPCDEEEIVHCVCQICAELDQKKRRLTEEQGRIVRKMEGSMLRSFFQDGLNHSLSNEHETLFERYADYMDFDKEAYALFYVYYLTEENLSDFLADIRKEKTDRVYTLYVKNTLLLFGKASGMDEAWWEKRIMSCPLPDRSVDLEVKSVVFGSLRELLQEVLQKVCRYEKVWFGSDLELAQIENQTGVQRQIEELLKKLLQCKENGMDQLWADFCVLIRNITDQEFFGRVASAVLIRGAMGNDTQSVARVCKILEELEESRDVEDMKEKLLSELERMFRAVNSVRDGISGQIEAYVDQHLEDTSLSLKWISEHVLFMNVDYVSRRFVKETGRKFSAFLAEKRIQKAKGLLLDGDMTLNEIAEKIGCGNNPQYFGQLFKKVEGISPGVYKERYRGMGRKTEKS